MARQQKYPETRTFHFYNANPKNRITGDCVVRAISLALDQDYNKTVMELAEMQCRTGYNNADKKLYGKYLEGKGWIKRSQPRKADGTKYTGEEFCREISKSIEFLGKTIVANIGGHHIVCIKETSPLGYHKVHDIWDSTDGCIGNYWIKK